MNITRWRGESAVSLPGAAPLVAWLEAVQICGDERAAEVAQTLAGVWRVWLDEQMASCESSVVWLLKDAHQLICAGSNGEFEGELDTETPVAFSDAAWPLAPFFLVEGEGESRELAQKLGLLSEKTKAPSLVVPLGESAILLLWLANEDGELGDEWKPLIEVAARHSGTLLGLARRLDFMGESLSQLAEAVGDAIDEREAHREGLSRAVAYYGGLIAREMALDEGEIARVEFAAHWHGLGRLSIPDAILGKTAPLNDEEREKVRGAAFWGAQKLENVSGFEEIAAMLKYQNHRYDGENPLDETCGTAIPLGARILAVASRFAAMTHSRADRGPLSVVGGAMDNVAQSAGAELDPEVVAAFLRAMGRRL